MTTNFHQVWSPPKKKQFPFLRIPEMFILQLWVESSSPNLNAGLKARNSIPMFNEALRHGTPRTARPFIRSFSMSPLRSGRLGKAGKPSSLAQESPEPQENPKEKLTCFCCGNCFWGYLYTVYIDLFPQNWRCLGMLFFDFKNKKTRGQKSPNSIGFDGGYRSPQPFLARSSSAEYHPSVGEWTRLAARELRDSLTVDQKATTVIDVVCRSPPGLLIIFW